MCWYAWDMNYKNVFFRTFHCLSEQASCTLSGSPRWEWGEDEVIFLNKWVNEII